MDAFIKRSPKEIPTYPGSSSQSGNAARGEEPPPPKRLRRDAVCDSNSDSDSDSNDKSSDGDGIREGSSSRFGDENEQGADRPVTEFENALPPTLADDKAIEEYEALKSSQRNSRGGTTSEKPRRAGAKYRSSIYVDAFNLALDTVLEEESKLFNLKEMEIFRQWKDLDYEAQHLYVRLFLRKTAAWHRSNRLGYHNDISDPDAAIKTLQIRRDLPREEKIVSTGDEIPGIGLDIVDEGEMFTFADASEDHIRTLEEAASMMHLDELKALAKEAKVQGRLKTDIIKALAHVSQKQTQLLIPTTSKGSNQESNAASPSEPSEPSERNKLQREESHRGGQYFLNKVFAIIGPCVRLSPLTFRLFERVHLVFYRSTEWTEKSLTTIILAKIARRNFPVYIVCRTATIFASRPHLLEFEAAIRLEAAVDDLLEMNASQAEANFRKIIDIFDKVYPRWKVMVAEEGEKEQRIYEAGEGAYLRRFNAAHSYTRIVLKAAYVFGRLKDHAKEYGLLTELLNQRLFHLARRGSWYQRKALLEEHYMHQHDPNPVSQNPEQQKKAWRAIAVSTCEVGLQDPDCHLIHHYDLQKRLVRLEKKMRIPRRLQHDFGHVRLADPLEIFVEGIQLKRNMPIKPGFQARSTKTIWLDELGSGGECSVEEMCLSHFRSQGWKGYHAEGGIVRTLFAYLFYDILFLYIPNVFQTAFQTCPLDLHTDAFFPARVSEINHRLVEIANGDGERILRKVWEREQERRTSVIGLNWDFDVEDLAELVGCFHGSALAALCKVMAQEYRQRGGGMPDLILWRVIAYTGEEVPVHDPAESKREVMFAEVKSANDRLSDTQRLWIHVLTGAGVKVALCNAVAKEVREVD